MIDVYSIERTVVVFAAIVSVAYVFAKVTQSTGSFTKGILAVSVTIDFYLVLMWIMGVNRPLFQICLERLGATITITALTLAIPVKLLFTIYLFIKQKQLQQLLG